MIWLLAGGFMVAAALIAGLFIIDRKSMKNVRGETGRSGNPGQKQSTASETRNKLLFDLSGDVVQQITKHIQKEEYEIIDQTIDKLELFPREKQNLIRQVLDRPVIRERYKAGLTDPNYKLRAASVERLGKIGGEGVSVLLFNAMADRNEEVRLAATASLKKLKDPSVAGMLIDALKFPNKWLPARIAEVLISLGEVSVTALQGALLDSDPVIRGYVIELLGEMGPVVPAAALYPALRDENSNVRLHAARVLGKIGSASSADLLVELLKDSETKVKVQAIRSLGKIGGSEAVKHLEKLLEAEGDSIIQVAVLDSLKLMGREG